MAENQIDIDVKLELQQANRALNKLNTNIENFSKESVKNFNKADAAASVFAGTLASDLASKAIGTLTGQLSKSFAEFREFNAALTEVTTISQFAKENTDSLTRALTSLSGKFATAPAKQAKAFYQIISSGAADGEDAIRLLDAANTTAQAGLADLGSTVNVITDIMNVYGSDVVSAAEASDSLFTTVRLGKTTISELASSMGQVLPIAERLNVGLDTVGAALATMTTQGLTTSERVTQLNALFTALFKKSGEAGAEFGEEVSKAFTLTSLRTKGLSRFLEDLVVATGNSEETLVRLLGRAEAAQAVFSLTGRQLGNFNRNLEQFEDKAGAGARAADDVSGAFDFQFEQASRNISNIVSQLIGVFEPITTKILKSFNESVEEQNQVVSALSYEELKKKLNEVTDEIEKAEKNFKELEAAGISAAGVFAGNADVDIKALKEEQTELKKLIELRKEQARQGEKEEDSDASGDSSVKKKKEELKGKFDAQKLHEENMSILEQETNQRKLLAMDEFNNEAFNKLQQFETRKNELQFQKELEKAQLIQDADKRTEKIKEINRKKELKMIELQGKQELDLLKRQQQQKEAIQRGAITAARGFLSAGIALAKRGSSEQKALSIADATINTYAAGVRAFKDYPYPANFAVLASTIATGLAQVAQIKKQSFATGGVAGGFVGATTGGDNMMSATVRQGEMQLTGRQQRNLFEAINRNQLGSQNNDTQIIDALNRIANTPITLNIGNKEVARAVRDAKREGFQV